MSKIDFQDPFGSVQAGVVVGSLAIQGGAEKVAVEIAEALDCPIYTGAYDPRKFDKEMNEKLDGRVVVLDRDREEGEFDEDSLHVQGAYETLVESDTFDKLEVESIAADVLVAADLQGAIVAYLSGKPYLTYTHHADKILNDYFWDLFDNKEKLTEKVKFLKDRYKSVRDSRAAARQAEHNMCNGQRTRKQVHERWGISPSQTSVVYPPVDTETFTPGPGADPLDGKDYFLAVQRMDPYKNVHTVVEAAKRARKHVIFVGSGVLEEYVRVQAQHSPYIHAFGFVDQEQLRDLYRGATATVQGTVKEDFGIAAAESLACGTPVIAPASGGFLETVGKEFRPDDDLPETYWTERGILLGPDDFSVEGFAGAMQYASGDVPDRFVPEEVFDEDNMREEAEKYNRERFAEEVRERVSDVYDSQHS